MSWRSRETPNFTFQCVFNRREQNRELLHCTSHISVATMWSISSIVSAALLFAQTQALYFYIDGPSQKCFFEELPKDTLVVGMAMDMNRAHRLPSRAQTDILTIGHFKASLYDHNTRTYQPNNDMVSSSPESNAKSYASNHFPDRAST